jgi:Domain of unknown function (DUF4124)
MTRFGNRTFLLSLGLVLALPAVADKVMYRWVDENGRVYFSDQVPPDQIQHKRETRDSEARVLDVVDKAKSGEEMAELKRLEALRQEQKKIIAQQETLDKTLLTTYRSVDDIMATQKNRLAAVENEKKQLQQTLSRYQNQLQQQQQQAANNERNAQSVPPQLVADIATSKQQIDSTNQEINRQTALGQQIEKNFAADIERYRFLTQNSERAKGSTPATEAESNLGLFSCKSTQQCQQAWRFAAEFVDQNSTTAADVNSDKLIMHAPPINDQDISLSVSKLGTEDQPQLFLDVRCKNSSLGSELCSSPKVTSIRQGFAAFLKSRLAAQ